MDMGERFNGYTHLLGLALAVLGAVHLLMQTLAGGDAANIAGALVFSMSTVAVYGASTLFHGARGERKRFWQRADHCAIYILIAGSYTPFALATMPAGWGLVPLALLWVAAIALVVRELRAHATAEPIAALYLGLGWACVLAAVPLAARLGSPALAWLVIGAAFYTSGLVFWRNRSGWRHAHGTWHLFVLGGTASHYVALAGFVL